ncbi:MAG: RNA-binding domain-containing protein, partial [Candidatus Margulisiibacteriota bacterium]
MEYKESEKLELKSSFGEWKDIIISICAFANKNGGKVIVGVDDDGNPTGLKVGNKTIEDIVNKIKTNTDPVLYPSINVKVFGPGEIVEIEIPESDNKPVFAFDRAYIRVGKTNQKLSSSAVKALIKRYTIYDFDEISCGQEVKDIELDVEFINKLNKDIYHFGKVSAADFMARLMLMKANKINNAGYLCFVKRNSLLP